LSGLHPLNRDVVEGQVPVGVCLDGCLLGSKPTAAVSESRNGHVYVLSPPQSTRPS
jgi:hypothetical protein